MEATRKYPAIHEIELTSEEHYHGLIELTKKDDDIIPLFIKTPSGELEIIGSFSDKVQEIREGFKLVYLGKMFDLDVEDEEESVMITESD
jgi:hypothetical protein